MKRIFVIIAVLTTISFNANAQNERIKADIKLEVVKDLALTDHQIFSPHLFDMDIGGRLVFFDFDRYELVVHELGIETFEFYGNRGKGPKEFGQIFDLKVDSNGEVFLIDTGNNKIIKWDVNGEYLREMSVGSRFIRPARLALCKYSDVMYILSSQYGRDGTLHRYNKDEDLKKSFYKIDDQDERLAYYTDGSLACDENENLYFAKFYVNEITKFDKTGRHIYTFPVYDSEPNEELLVKNGRYTSLYFQRIFNYG